MDINDKCTEADSASDRASSKLMRDALASYGLNNFESALNAVEDFLCNVELFDPNVGFGQAAEALAAAGAVFALIDVNHDQRLSHSEISAYSNLLNDRTTVLIEWILLHYDAIQRAGFGHSTRGISPGDLNQAADFFRGLEFTHTNFDKLAHLHGSSLATLTHIDIEYFLSEHSAQLDSQAKAGLMALARYLRNLEMHGHPQGLRQKEVDNLSPEDIWQA